MKGKTVKPFFYIAIGKKFGNCCLFFIFADVSNGSVFKSKKYMRTVNYYKCNKYLGILFMLFLLVTIVLIDQFVIVFGQMKYFWTFVISIVSSVVIVAILGVIIKVNERKTGFLGPTLKQKILLTVTNTCSGSLLDIIAVLMFVCFMAWIPDSVTDFVKNGGVLYLLRPIVYVVALFVMVWIKPVVYVGVKKIEPEKRKLLLSGMSSVGLLPSGELNIVPFIKPLESFCNVSTIVVLLSDKIYMGAGRLKNNLDNMQELTPTYELLYEYAKEMCEIETKIRNMSASNEKFEKEGVNIPNGKIVLDEAIKGQIKYVLNKFLTKLVFMMYGRTNIEFVFSNLVDYNDFDSCNNECYTILLSQLRAKNYEDSDVVVNITPGTSVVASVMTINAIKGEREMIYMSQTNGQIESITPDVTLVQFDSWLQDRAERLGA